MNKQRYEAGKLQQKLRRETANAITDFNMIEAGDRVMVCLSGGKDSYTLLTLLRALQKRAPIHFDLIAVNLDQKQPGFPEHVLPDYLDGLGLEYHIIEEDTYSIVKDKVPEGKTTCGLCSRLRRGILYRFAREHRIDKIALGHHRDDAMETLFLNLFFGGVMKTMPAKLLSDDGENMVIRPLIRCREKDIERFAAAQNYPIIPCNLCGSQDHLQRQAIKHMLRDWERIHPRRIESIAKAMAHVVPSHMLDQTLFDFTALKKSPDMPLAPLRKQS